MPVVIAAARQGFTAEVLALDTDNRARPVGTPGAPLLTIKPGSSPWPDASWPPLHP